MINNNDVDTHLDDSQQSIDCPVGYTIPFIWLICFYCLWKSQQRSFAELREREARNETLVAFPV